jgi:hypothetical protein
MSDHPAVFFGDSIPRSISGGKDMLDYKRELKSCLEANYLEGVTTIIAEHPEKMSQLIRLSYDKDTLAGWRAILAVGMAARELVRTDPGFLRETCRKLLWSLNDESGGIGWSAPELLGEIVSSDPKRFVDIIPLIVGAYDIEGGLFKAGVLYALTRIAEMSPEDVVDHADIISRSLEDRDPHVRLRGIICINHLLDFIRRKGLWSDKNWGRIRSKLLDMSSDKGESWVYREHDFVSITVSEEAIKIIKSL